MAPECSNEVLRNKNIFLIGCLGFGILDVGFDLVGSGGGICWTMFGGLLGRFYIVLSCSFGCFVGGCVGDL